MAKGKSESTGSRAELLEAKAKELINEMTNYRPSRPGVRGWNSSGSPVLDAHIGQGPGRLGYPQGKVVELFGPESGGKTGTMMEAMAEAQRRGGFAVLISCEGLDDFYAEHICGLDIHDPNKWAMYEAYNLEGAWGLVEAVCVQFHNVTYPVVVGVDSISGLGVKAEDMHTKDVEDTQGSATPAKWLHNAFRRGVLYYLSPSTITLFLIRHQTSGVRAFQGATVTHGKSIDFHASLRLQIWREQMKEKDSFVGYFRNIKCVKSKVGTDKWQIQQPIYQGVGRDPAKETILFLKNAKVIKKAGSYLTVNGENQYESVWLERYRDHPDWRAYFDNLAIETLGSMY